MRRFIPQPEVEVMKALADAMLAPFFNGRGAAPVIARPAPVRPAPARELVVC